MGSSVAAVWNIGNARAPSCFRDALRILWLIECAMGLDPQDTAAKRIAVELQALQDKLVAEGFTLVVSAFNDIE